MDTLNCDLFIKKLNTYAFQHVLKLTYCYHSKDTIIDGTEQKQYNIYFIRRISTRGFTRFCLWSFLLNICLNDPFYLSECIDLYTCNFADNRTFYACNKELLQRTSYKIRSIQVSDSTKKLESFLSNRFQSVTINGQSSNWLPVKAGTTKTQLQGHCFFLYQRSF